METSTENRSSQSNENKSNILVDVLGPCLDNSNYALKNSVPCFGQLG